MSQKPTYVYYSHHKCATGWTASILRELSFHIGARFKTAHGPQQYEHVGTLAQWVDRENVDFLAYTNANIRQAKQLPEHLGFHVVRDPRDVLVSGYFSHKNSHPTDNWPELEEHRSALQSLSKEEGLLKEIEFSRPFFEDMLTWDYDQPHVLELKMENLTSDPHHYFQQIVEHLCLHSQSGSLSRKAIQKANRVLYATHHRMPGNVIPAQLTTTPSIEPAILISIIENHTFDKMAGGRSKGEEDKKSHYRKGKSGDWQNHFTDRVMNKFEDLYGGIVKKLGFDKK